MALLILILYRKCSENINVERIKQLKSNIISNRLSVFSIPDFDWCCIVWIVHLVSDMSDHVFHKLRFIDETCTIPSRHSPSGNTTAKLIKQPEGQDLTGFCVIIQLDYILYKGKKQHMIFNMLLLVGRSTQREPTQAQGEHTNWTQDLRAAHVNDFESYKWPQSKCPKFWVLENHQPPTNQYLWSSMLPVDCFIDYVVNVCSSPCSIKVYSLYLCGQPQLRSTPSEKGATTQAASARVWASWAANCTIRGRSSDRGKGKHNGDKGDDMAITKLSFSKLMCQGWHIQFN